MATPSEHGNVAVGSGAEPTNKDEAKRAVSRPATTPTKPNDNLSEDHVIRAANEYLLALRPQPSSWDIQAVLSKLREKDDKGDLKAKCKDVDAAIAATDKALSEVTKPAEPALKK